MKKILLLVTLLITFGMATATFAKDKTTLTISAAAGLKDVLTEASKLYQKTHDDVEIKFNFAASGALFQQIENGAQPDIFISASKKFIDKLRALTPIATENITVLTSTKIVLVVPVADLKIQHFSDLTGPEIKLIAIGEPASVPAGQYGIEALASLKLLEQLKTKFVYGKDVRSVLNYVALGNADAGLVYYSDAISTDKVRIADTAPDNTHTPIQFISATLSQEQYGADFIKYLTHLPDLFKRYGFSNPATSGK